MTLRKLCRNAYRILNRICVGGAVSDAADSFNAQERCSAVLRVIKSFLEVAKGASGEQGSNLTRDGCLQTFLQGLPYQCGYSFGSLQRNIAHEAIANNY